MDMQGLSVLCAGLGIAEEDEEGTRIGYTKGDNCLDNLKDLLRFLRRDDTHRREVFKQACKWNIVSKDLVPIIQFHHDDRNLVLNAVKVLVFLTMPIEPSSCDIPQQIDYLWGLKSAITYSDAVPVIVSLLEGPLENVERESFTDDDWKLVQLVLTLFRNILAIQDISLLHNTGGSTCQLLVLRDRFLELLFHEHVMDLIIVIAQHVDDSYGYFRKDKLLLLEIFHYIFMGQEPELIAKANLKNSKVVGDAKSSLDSLKSIMKEEEEKRKHCGLRNMGRHSQFSGTFTRLNMDGSKAVYNGTPSSASHNIKLKLHKVQRGPVKKILWEHGRLTSTKHNILELLHDFVNQFLSGGYNVLMQSIHEDIEKERPEIQKSDIVIFFQVAKFVTSFQYHKFFNSQPNTEKEASQVFADEYSDSTVFKGDICGPIAASMNESMFLLVILRWRHAFDGLKETNDYQFLSAAGSLMKIMIRMLDLVLKILPEDSKEPQTARILLYKLFYDQTDQGMTQFLLSLIKSFDTHKQTKSDLADLVEMIHVIVRLMENLQTRGTLRVSKISRKSRKKKPTIDNKEIGNERSGDEANMLDQTVLFGTEQSNDLQKESQVNAASDPHQNISIAARIDELEITVPEMGNLGSNLHQMDNRIVGPTDNDLSCSSDDEQPVATYEVDFKVSTLIATFANQSIIQNLCWLLRFYKNNSISTNHYIICMLRRITDDLDLAPILYQLSLLKVFYEILEDQKSCPCKEYANIVDFLTRLVRRMLRKLKNQPLLFVEVLFWKSRKECHYINAEYLLHELGNMKKETGSWGNISANGDIESSRGRGWVPRNIAEALGDDEADVVISHEQEPQSGGNAMEHAKEGVSKRKKRLILTDEMEIQMKDLYERFKDEGNCSRLIAEALDPDGQVSAAQVFSKLKQLGLKVTSKKRRLHDKSFSANPDSGEDGSLMEKEIDLDNSINAEGSFQTKSLSTRKRIRAFSKDQEEMIKRLFEQFKDHKRCNYMIANALAGDNSITPAQVSRKLKQLGLLDSRKRSKADMHLRDEELNDVSIVEGRDSDDETLLSLRNRSKNKDGGTLLGDKFPKQNIEGQLSGDSDDELLSSILKSKTKDNAKLLVEEQNNAELSDDSNNKILSSKLKKTRKLLRKAKDKELTAMSIKTMVTDENSGNGVPKIVAERVGGSDPVIGVEGINEDDDISFNHVIEDSISEANEATGIISRNPPGHSAVNDGGDLPHQRMDDDALVDADTGDGATFDGLIKSTNLRRKFRMVLDAEDD